MRTKIVLYKQAQQTEVIKIIKFLKPSKAEHIYSLSSNFLQHIILETCILIALIFNKCIDEGAFSDELKTAKVMPIHKKITDLSLFFQPYQKSSKFCLNIELYYFSKEKRYSIIASTDKERVALLQQRIRITAHNYR